MKKVTSKKMPTRNQVEVSKHHSVTVRLHAGEVFVVRATKKQPSFVCNSVTYMGGAKVWCSGARNDKVNDIRQKRQMPLTSLTKVVLADILKAAMK